MYHLANGRYHLGSPLQQKLQQQNHQTVQHNSLKGATQAESLSVAHHTPKPKKQQSLQPRFGYLDWTYMVAGGYGYIVKTPEEHAFDAVLNKIRSDDQAFAHVEVQKWVDEQVQKLELASKPAGFLLPEALQRQLNQLLAKSFEKSNFLVMSQLLKAGADPNGVFEDDPMLRWAINVDSADGVALLVKHGAKTEYPPSENQKGFNAYIEAWAKENKSFSNLLAQLGASKQGRDGSGRTLLSWAAKQGDSYTMSQLLDEGHLATESQVHPKNNAKPATLLSYVISWLDPESPLAERLIKPIAEAGLLQTNGASLWEDIADLPVGTGSSWVRKLISSGLSPNQPLSEAWGTPWLMASKKGDLLLIKTLLEAQNPGVENPMTQVDDLGRNALFLSVQSGNLFAFLYLKNLGFPLTATTKNGESLLHEALSPKVSIQEEDQRLMMLKALIDLGAPLNIQDKWGATPLHRAVASKNLKVAEMLLSAGANPLLKDNAGKMAVELVDRNTTNPYTGGFSHDALSLFYLLRDATFASQAKEKQPI